MIRIMVDAGLFGRYPVSCNCWLAGPGMLQRFYILSHTVVVNKVLKRLEHGLTTCYT